MFKRRAASAADSLRPTIFGEAPAVEFLRHVDSNAPAPWGLLLEIRDMLDSGRIADATKIAEELAGTEDIDSRVVLEAWYFLRLVGAVPPADRAKQVLGVVAEFPTSGGLDLLAAYADGGVRYLHHGGSAAIIEDQSLTEVNEAVQRWLASGAVLAGVIGPWDQREIPVLPRGQARISVLTPSGRHFGQSTLEALQSQPLAAQFLTPACELLLLVVDLAKSNR